MAKISPEYSQLFNTARNNLKAAEKIRDKDPKKYQKALLEFQKADARMDLPGDQQV
jgi:hypothetical protein